MLVHGWGGSEPGHWQSWLAGELREAGREVRFPVLPDPETPNLAAWSTALREALDGLPEGGFDVVTHSLGSVLWLHHAASQAGGVHDAGRSPRPARVALVAPVSPHFDAPEIREFLPPPLDIDALRRSAEGTVLVAGDVDEFCPETVALAYGRPLKLPTTVVPGGGHLNPESGFGPWPAMLDWCRRDNLAFLL